MDILLTILLVLFLIGFLFRLFAPFLLRLFVKRISRRFGAGQQYNNGGDGQTRARRQRPEGEVTIEQNSAHEKVIDENIGDYIDFEESKQT